MTTIQSPLSQGAIMLIGRMQANPEEFQPGGRLHRVISDAVFARGVWRGERDMLAVPVMGLADAEAVIRAFEHHIMASTITEMAVKAIIGGEPWGAADRLGRSVNLTAQQARAISATQPGAARDRLMGMLTGGQQP